MATIQLGVINDIGIIRIAPFTAVELKCLASAVNADNSAALADAATESANAAAATALSYVGTSPTGAYTNLAALQAAYSTGEDGVFVVKDTGHWYFWNGSAWEDGGEYQKDIPTTTIEELRRSDLQQMSAIKEVENTLNSININQETTNTASGYGTLSLPKNAANGGMSVKLEGFTAENLVVNGDFSDGVTGWSIYNAGVVLAIEGDYLTYISDNPTQAIQQTGKSYATGDKLYVYAIMKVDETSTGMTAGVALSAVGTVLLPTVTVGVTDTVVRGIITAQSNLTSIVFGRTETVNKKVYLKKGARVVNLTATFGADNEPTVEECDAMFGEYFEGVKSFEPTGRVRSVGKNLIDGEKFADLIIKSVNDINVAYKTVIDGKRVLALIGKSTLLSAVLPFTLLRATGYTLSGNTKMDSANKGGMIRFVYDDGTYSLSLYPVSNTFEARSTASDPLKSITGIGFNYSIYGEISYFEIDSLQIERGSTATPYEPYKETSLYLTAPELRSNGTVKDEIRKGENGYELIKRVGVGTLGSELITNGGFDTEATWLKQSGWTISGGTASYDATSNIVNIRQAITLELNSYYEVKFTVLSGTARISINTFIGGEIGFDKTTNYSVGTHTIRLKTTATNGIAIFAYNTDVGTAFSLDNFSIKKINANDGVIADTSMFTVLGSNIHYTLATPVITPISYGGILNSAESGTVYHEPIIADAGVYGTSLSILMTDYPIDSLEEIIKYEDGAETRLDTSTAVIAGDGLSFTHPDLSDGDLVLFTYAFDKESTSGNITATFYDSNVVKIDTATGTAYKIEDVVTNGILTRTLTEV